MKNGKSIFAAILDAEHNDESRAATDVLTAMGLAR